MLPVIFFKDTKSILSLIILQSLSLNIFHVNQIEYYLAGIALKEPFMKYAKKNCIVYTSSGGWTFILNNGIKSLVGRE